MQRHHYMHTEQDEPQVEFSTDGHRAATPVAFGWALYEGATDEHGFQGRHVGIAKLRHQVDAFIAGAWPTGLVRVYGREHGAEPDA